MEPWDSVRGHQGSHKEIGGNGRADQETVYHHCQVRLPGSMSAYAAPRARDRGSMAEEVMRKSSLIFGSLKTTATVDLYHSKSKNNDFFFLMFSAIN